MRLMSAAPRDVAAKSRSSATTFGRCRVIRSSALQRIGVGEGDGLAEIFPLL